MIPNGSTVTYTGKWPPGKLGFEGADSVISRVGTVLSKYGLVIRSQSSDAGWSTYVLGSGIQVTLEIGIENGQGYAKPDDIINTVAHAVYETLGRLPSSGSIPYYKIPNGTETATGQPSSTPQGQGCVAGASTDLTGAFDFSCWWGNLTQKGLASVGFLAIIAILGIGIALYAGVRPHAARE